MRKMDAKWQSYIQYNVDYPHPAVEPLQPGTMFCYVSSTFLNGWINYVGDVRRAYLVTRYQHHDENVAALEKWHRDRSFHSDLGSLGDDVHLIAKDEDGKWWYFWYDRDCSDCCIGILDTKDSDEDVIAAFDEHVNYRHGTGSENESENGDAPSDPLAIDLKSILGWVKG